MEDEGGTAAASACASGTGSDGRKDSSDGSRMSFVRYIFAEVSRGYLMEYEEDEYTEKQRRVLTFMKTPRELEKLMLFGFLICFDAFLFVFTFLPVRVLVAVGRGALRLLLCCRGELLEPAQKCDLIRATNLLLCCFVMQYVDTSALYHVIRGQSVIKLYVIYNMLEIFDRLLSSIGQDTLDSLYWVTYEQHRRRKACLETVSIFYFIVANGYVFVHSVLLLFQAVTLNVAINSHNKALLTIMVSNNFVEIKGSVFKKFETKNLFQMSCSDIRERFHHVVLLSVVAVRNLAQFEWNLAHLEDLLPEIVLVLLSEVFVDWIKHAFITKFNSISPDVYHKYRAVLAKDLATSRHKRAKAEHSDLVSRRMGFIPLPLGCLVWQTVYQSASLPGLSGKVLLAVFYLCLMAFKVLTGIVLLGKACTFHRTHTSTLNKEEEEEEGSCSESSASASGAAPTGYGEDSIINKPQRNIMHHGSDTCSSCHGDKGREETTTTSSRRRSRAGPGAQLKMKRKSSLEDVHRYTLCSNRIV